MKGEAKMKKTKKHRAEMEKKKKMKNKIRKRRQLKQEHTGGEQCRNSHGETMQNVEAITTIDRGSNEMRMRKN